MADRVTRPDGREMRLHSGDRLDQKTFHALYEQTAENFKAELIGGIVYVASPTSFRHGRPHARMVLWLGTYSAAVPGLEVLDNTTNILADDSEPQPDVCLRVAPEYGGQTWNEGDYLHGAAELVVEIAYSSAAIDLHAKKRDYERAGVKEYLVVLVDAERVVWFTRPRKGFSEMRPAADGLLQSRLFPGLWLDPAGAFAKTPQRLLTILRDGLETDEHTAFVKSLELRRLMKRKRKPKL